MELGKSLHGTKYSEDLERYLSQIGWDGIRAKCSGFTWHVYHRVVDFSTGNLARAIEEHIG